MANIIDKIVTERHHLILDEAKVVETVKRMKEQGNVRDMEIGPCGWANDPNKWFIYFTTTREVWYRIRNDLNIIRVWGYAYIPDGDTGKIYSDD